jgi:hypothetical protein
MEVVRSLETSMTIVLFGVIFQEMARFVYRGILFKEPPLLVSVHSIVTCRPFANVTDV